MAKEEKIFHTCICTGRKFTHKQWCEYLEEHPDSGREPVSTYKTFGFNINDICVSPKIPVTIKCNLCSLEIHTAESPNGRWSYGRTLHLCSSGYSRGAQFINDPAGGFPSEKDAIYDALSEAEQEAEKELKAVKASGDPETATHPTAIRQFLSEVRRKKDIYDPAQLSLFDL